MAQIFLAFYNFRRFTIRFLEVRASHGPGPSVTRSLTLQHIFVLYSPYSPIWDNTGSLWSCMVPYGPIQFPMIRYGTLWSHTVLYGIVWFLRSHMALYGPIWLKSTRTYHSKQSAGDSPQILFILVTGVRPIKVCFLNRFLCLSDKRLLTILIKKIN